MLMMLLMQSNKVFSFEYDKIAYTITNAGLIQLSQIAKENARMLVLEPDNVVTGPSGANRQHNRYALQAAYIDDLIQYIVLNAVIPILTEQPHYPTNHNKWLQWAARKYAIEMLLALSEKRS